MSRRIRRGSVVWVNFDPTIGREQQGTRPALVVSSTDYLASVRGVVIVLPITTVDRGWPHHVPVSAGDSGLPRPSFVMTEQPRTVSVERISTRRGGVVDTPAMAEIDRWLRDFLFD